MAMLPATRVSVFCVNGGSHAKYTYMIGRKYSHVALPDYASISPSPLPYSSGLNDVRLHMSHKFSSIIPFFILFYYELFSSTIYTKKFQQYELFFPKIKKLT